MRKSPSTAIFILLLTVLSGCAGVNSPSSPTAPATPTAAISPTRSRVPSRTPTATSTPLPTFVPLPSLYYGPTLPPDHQLTATIEALTRTPVPTLTAPPQRNPPLELPADLFIEEFPMTEDISGYSMEFPVKDRMPYPGGLWIFPQSAVLNGQLFTTNGLLVETPMPDKEALTTGTYRPKLLDIYVTGLLDGREIYRFNCSAGIMVDETLSVWAYGAHSIIQTLCYNHFDIFWDGVSLNESRGYQESYLFQLLDGKPFYLFKRNDKIWLWYDGEERLLGYDELHLTYCCEEHPAPSQYEYAITFIAQTGDDYQYVLIGVEGSERYRSRE